MIEKRSKHDPTATTRRSSKLETPGVSGSGQSHLDRMDTISLS